MVSYAIGDLLMPPTINGTLKRHLIVWYYQPSMKMRKIPLKTLVSISEIFYFGNLLMTCE